MVARLVRKLPRVAEVHDFFFHLVNFLNYLFAQYLKLILKGNINAVFKSHE